MLNMQISAGDSVVSMLDDLGDAEKKEFKKTAKRAVRTGLKPLLIAARAAAPKKTGRLRRAIKQRAWRRPARGEVGSKVSIDPGRKRNDTKGAYYGLMVEWGYIVDGRYVGGVHMLGKAYKQHGTRAQLELAMALSTEIDGVINRHRRRRSKGQGKISKRF